ncbi:MAG: C-GCAxxG-C-C family protein [Christensenellales bacterium]|jgi:C_GCAxxG_C_C family probable redox protein
MEEKATLLHEGGYNCAQSVLGALTDDTGQSLSLSLAVSGGFGGGMRASEICGAVTGAVMALGLAFPYDDWEDTQAKDRIANITREFLAQFKEKHSTIICRELLGYDMEKEKGMIHPEINQRICPDLIRNAVTIAHKLIEAYNGKNPR